MTTELTDDTCATCGCDSADRTRQETIAVVARAGDWRYVYRAIDQHGQDVDAYVSKRRNIEAATRFFETMPAGRQRAAVGPDRW